MSKYVTDENRTLVIVESPTKCKKIEEYLGQEPSFRRYLRD